MTANRGLPLAPVTHLEIIKGQLCATPVEASWVLSGLVRKTRYVSREEPTASDAGDSSAEVSAPSAALIAVRRSAEWWELGHQVRRQILETQSYFLATGLGYLSGIVRRWQHRRDLSEQFDGVTWFEYEPRDSAPFEELLTAWRASEEWNYVDRECDIRLVMARP